MTGLISKDGGTNKSWLKFINCIWALNVKSSPFLGLEDPPLLFAVCLIPHDVAVLVGCLSPLQPPQNFRLGQPNLLGWGGQGRPPCPSPCCLSPYRLPSPPQLMSSSCESWTSAGCSSDPICPSWPRACSGSAWWPAGRSCGSRAWALLSYRRRLNANAATSTAPTAVRAPFVPSVIIRPELLPDRQQDVVKGVRLHHPLISVWELLTPLRLVRCSLGGGLPPLTFLRLFDPIFSMNCGLSCKIHWRRGVCFSSIASSWICLLLYFQIHPPPRPLLQSCPEGRWGGRGGWYSLLVSWRSRSEERRVGKECRSRWSPYH